MKSKSLFLILLCSILLYGFIFINYDNDKSFAGETSTYRQLDWIFTKDKGLLYPDDDVSQILIGGTVTTTDAQLEIQGASGIALTDITNSYLATDGSGIIVATTTPTGGTGTINTISNIGDNTYGWFKQLTGSDAEFKSPLAGYGIELTDTGDEIVLSVTSTVSNLFNQWLDTTNTPTFAGLNASSTNVDSLTVFTSLSGAGFNSAWDSRFIATTTWPGFLGLFENAYNATTTLNGFTPSNYLAIADFSTYFQTNYNATTTINGTDFSVFIDNYSDESIGGIKTINQPLRSPENATTSDSVPNWGQVSAISQGLIVKESVRVATTGNITTSTLQLIDGVTVSAGDRVLVKNQTDARRNGIFVAAVGDWARATDYDTSAEVQEGTFCSVLEGTLNANKLFVQVTIDPVLETDNLVFTELSSAITYNAGSGLFESSNTFYLGAPLTQDTTITLGTNNMTFNLNNSGDFYIKDNGSPVLTVSDSGLTTITDLQVTTGKFDWLSATSSLDYYVNSTSTWHAFDTNWARNFNATNTWWAFDTNFDRMLSATTTLDLNSLFVTQATSTSFAITGLATPAGAFLAVNPQGTVITTTTPTGGGGATALADLTDVSLSSPVIYDILQYNGSDWTNIANATSSITGGGTIPWQVAASPATAQTWTNMPAAETTLFGSTIHQNQIDLTNAFKYRIKVNQAVAGFAGADLNLECSTDNGSTWVNADTNGVGERDIGTGTGFKTGNWASLSMSCRTDVRVRIVGKEGDGIVDPSFRGIQVEFGTNSTTLGANATTTIPWALVSTPMTNQTWSNIPSARSGTYYEAFGSSIHRQKLQMHNAISYRMVAGLDSSVVPDPGTTVNLECSTDGTTWIYADGVAGTAGALDITATLGSPLFGNWATIADGCKGERYFRVVGYGGNGVIDPRFRSLSVQFAVTQDAFGSWFSDWELNSDGQLTPTSTVDVLMPANATTTGHLAALGGNSDQWNLAYSSIWDSSDEENFWNTTTTWAAFKSNFDSLHNATTTYPGFQTQFDTAFSATTTWASFGSNFETLHNATNTYPGFQSQFDTAFSATTTWASFSTNWNNLFNNTTTWAGFASNWNSLFNNTTTWAGFQSEFDNKLSATTTLDLNTLEVTTLTVNGTSTLATTTIQLGGNSINIKNFDVGSGNYVPQILFNSPDFEQTHIGVISDSLIVYNTSPSDSATILLTSSDAIGGDSVNIKLATTTHSMAFYNAKNYSFQASSTATMYIEPWDVNGLTPTTPVPMIRFYAQDFPFGTQYGAIADALVIGQETPYSENFGGPTLMFMPDTWAGGNVPSIAYATNSDGYFTGDILSVRGVGQFKLDNASLYVNTSTATSTFDGNLKVSGNTNLATTTIGSPDQFFTFKYLELTGVGIFPYIVPHASLGNYGGWADNFGLFDHDGDNTLGILFSKEDFSESASITADLSNHRFEFGYDMTPTDGSPNTYDLGKSGLEWKDGYFGGIMAIGTSTPWAGYELALTGDFVATGNSYINGELLVGTPINFGNNNISGLNVNLADYGAPLKTHNYFVSYDTDTSGLVIDNLFSSDFTPSGNSTALIFSTLNQINVLGSNTAGVVTGLKNSVSYDGTGRIDTLFGGDYQVEMSNFGYATTAIGLSISVLNGLADVDGGGEFYNATGLEIGYTMGIQSGTTTNMTLFDSNITIQGGTTTNLYNFESNQANFSDGYVGTHYGFYSPAWNNDNSDISFPVYITNGISYFGGQVGISTTSPWYSYELAVNGESVLGGDVLITGNATTTGTSTAELFRMPNGYCIFEDDTTTTPNMTMGKCPN